MISSVIHEDSLDNARVILRLVNGLPGRCGLLAALRDDLSRHGRAQEATDREFGGLNIVVIQ